MKKTSKWPIWTKWSEPFEDELEAKEDYMCTWSAEDQKILLENPANKTAVAKVSLIFFVLFFNFIASR